MRWRSSTGDALTQIGSTLTVSANARLSAWRLIAPSAESNTSYGNWAASQDECSIGMVSYTGVDQTTPVGTPVTNTGSSGSGTSVTATVDVTTTVGQTVFAVAFVNLSSSADTTITAAPGTGCTERYDIDGSQLGGWSALGAVERVATGTTTTVSVDFSWSVLDVASWGIIAFVVNASAGAAVTPGVGQLTLTGHAPTVLSPLNVAPSVGTLTVAGYVPTVSIAGTGTSITTGVGTLVVTGYEPTQDYQTDAPQTGTLTLTGYAPTVRATQSVAAGVGTLTLTGYAPALAFSYTITPAAGALTATGYAPTAGISYTVAPGNAPLSLTGYVPGVQVTQPGQVTPDAGTLILTGYQPGVGISYTVVPVVGALSVTGLAPTVQVTLSAAPSVADLTLTGHAPTVQATANVWITPDAGTVVIGGYAPVLSQAGSFAANPDVGQIILAGFAPNVVNSGDAIDERAAGGHPLYRRWATWQTRLPTDEEIRKQREALGILPKRAQKIVRAEVKRITDGVDSPEQAALLASAYTQESQRDRLKARLKADSDAANLRWRDEMAAIASALILGELKRRADEELLAQLMAAEEQERRDIGDLLQIWMQM